MKKVVFTFGRMNPPTIGHEKLVKKVQDVARSNGADARVYLSHTSVQDDPKNKKDPLNYRQKIKYAKKAFGNIVIQSQSKTVFQIMSELEKGGYTDVVMVVGSDRVPEFKKLLNKYNGKEYNFDSISVVSAGERDPDATGVEGMSASKLRAVAKEGDFDTFKQGLPKGLTDRDAKAIFDTINKFIKESIEEQRAPLTIAQRQAVGRRMKRLAPKLARFRKMKAKRMADREQILKRAQKAARNVIRKKVAGERGADYSALSASEKITIDKLVAKKSAVIKKLAKKLLPKVRKSEIERLKSARGQNNEELDIDALFEEVVLIEKEEAPKKTAQDPDVKDVEGTQPKKYYKGLSKDDKEARAKQFAKGADKPDDSPSSYKPAPGDADAKTKPSKHTLKYKKMFGEQDAVKAAQEKIKREKEADKRKHDAMLDRARTQDTQSKNTQSEEYELSEDASASLKKKSEKSGIPVGILRQVYNRGMAAWKTGHRPGASQQQWGFARVNSFITKGKGTWGGADSDLASKVRGTKKESLDEAMSPKLAKIIHNFDLILAGEKEVAKVLKQAKLNKDDLDYALRFFSKELDGKLIKKHLGLKEEVELDEARAKKAVASGKVQKYITGFGMSYKGKKYDEIDFERVSIDNSSQIVTLKILHPSEHIGDEVKVPFKTLRMGRFMATDTSKINEAVELDEKCWDGYKQVGMKKKGDKMVPDCVPEASSPEQQAAIAISKKKKKLNAMLGVPTARPVVPMGEEALEEMPRWLLEPLSKVTRKKGYDAAKKVLKDVLARKKKEGGKKGLPHTIEYYAGQIARQFDGVDARTLADMVNETPEKMDAPKVGTDEIKKRYADMTPGQNLDESINVMFAKEFIQFQGAYAHHPDVEEELERRAEMKEACCDDCEDHFDHIVEETEYQGKKVTLNNPFRTSSGPKKFSVYVKNEKGNVVKVNFGDPNMEIKRDDPKRRASFRARHGCDNPGPKWKAKYWSCYQWRAGSKVDN